MTKSKEIRYKENPFLESLSIQTAGKRVSVNVMGSDDNVLVNQATGEVKGTVVTTFKQVDDEQFLKLFTKNIAHTFDLKAAGIKALTVLGFAMKDRIKCDRITLDMYLVADFLEAHKDRNPPLKLSESTFMRGLKELETAQIIAKAQKRGDYFINPSFIFNGDRIAFNMVIERQKKEEEQLNLLGND